MGEWLWDAAPDEQMERDGDREQQQARTHDPGKQLLVSGRTAQLNLAFLQLVDLLEDALERPAIGRAEVLALADLRDLPQSRLVDLHGNLQVRDAAAGLRDGD